MSQCKICGIRDDDGLCHCPEVAQRVVEQLRAQLAHATERRMVWEGKATVHGKVAQEFRETCEQLRAERDRLRARTGFTWCAQCGSDVAVDEDGCCLGCGGDAVGEGADRAAEYRAECYQLRAENAELREAAESRDVEIEGLETSLDWTRKYLSVLIPTVRQLVLGCAQQPGVHTDSGRKFLREMGEPDPYTEKG